MVKERRTKPAEWTEEEKRIKDSQLVDFRPMNQRRKTQENCIATALLGIINQAIFDAISKPVEIKVDNKRQRVEKEREEKQRRTGRPFLDSEDCRVLAEQIRLLGRTPPNLRYIARKCDEFTANGIFFTTDQMDDLLAQESSDVETVEVPLSSDRLAA